jgi:hypothetical protein
MAAPLLIAKAQKTELYLLPALANRHGLITGATGTGKTVTLQTIAQQLSQIGVPVFMADVKGDLAGLAKPGGGNPKVEERAKTLKLDLKYEACPVVFWDVFGTAGHPVRATVSDMGPLLLSRLLALNDTQEGVLNLVFKIADDNGLLLLDAKDLRAMLQHVGDNASQFTTEYGNISAASIGAIQRGVLALESQGAGQVLRRADARHRRPDAGRPGQGRDQHPRRGQAAQFAEALFDVPACGCSRSSSSTCPKSAIRKSRSSCSSSTRRTCSSTRRRRRCSRRSSRSCG